MASASLSPTDLQVETRLGRDLIPELSVNLSIASAGMDEYSISNDPNLHLDRIEKLLY